MMTGCLLRTPLGVPVRWGRDRPPRRGTAGDATGIELARPDADNAGMSSKAKRIAKAIGLGILLQAHLFILASTMGSHATQARILWNAYQPLEQGDVPAMVAGFALGMAIYSTAFYVVLRARDALRTRRADAPAQTPPPLG